METKELKIALNDLSFLLSSHEAADERKAIIKFYELICELGKSLYRNIGDIHGDYPRYINDIRAALSKNKLDLCLNHDQVSKLLAFLGRLVPVEDRSHHFSVEGMKEKSYCCAWAREGLLISATFDDRFSGNCIIGTIDSKEEISIGNIADKYHTEVYAAELGRRKYIRSEKHHIEEYRSRGFKVSKMDLRDEAAQELLDKAVNINKDSTRLYCYDNKTKRYYAFPLTRGNIYHGFVYDCDDEYLARKIRRAMRN